MAIALVTGSAGLIGSASVRFLADRGLEVIGIDNDMRSYFFGPDASTVWSREKLLNEVPGFVNLELDIRDREAMARVFARYGEAIALIVHTAAQPSHDWSAREPLTDFDINAVGTVNLLESCRRFAPEAVFIFTSTNKVYGDSPNRLPLIELESRWELDPSHPFSEHGIDESMNVDRSLHSLFGASKTAADLMVQEYGRYFGLRTACFRGGCLTGPQHSGAELHGFLSYLARCAVSGDRYTVYGYKGKQVRDNIHAYDLVNAFWHFFQSPRCGEVYNIGGGRSSNCSIREAIGICEGLTGRRMDWEYSEQNRIGDHVWYVSDCRRFNSQYPDWHLTYDVESTLSEIHDSLLERLAQGSRC